MNKKQFMVVQLPNENEMGDTWLSEPAHFDDFGDAFDALNESIASDGGKQLLKQPKGEKPMRVALSDRQVELWVITRTGELSKA